LPPISGPTYRCLRPLNLYKTPHLQDLVTQARAGGYLQFTDTAAVEGAVAVRLWEDGYPGWIAQAESRALTPVDHPYAPIQLDRAAIAARLPQVIAFARQAMAQPNRYLWGGTVGPDFDCSGLVQTAFGAAGIILPRDSYQQEAFTAPIAWRDLEPGDLVFFGSPERTQHVGLYLGGGTYIHSSGIDQGRNGIGLDSLTDLSDPISRTYYEQRRRPGRVIASYCPD